MNSMGNSIGIPEFIRGLEWAYLLLWAVLLVLALWWPKSGKAKLVAALLVLGFGSVLPAYLALGAKKRQEERQPIVEKEQAQFKAAMARFEERCKTAGEKIYRTVEDVEGVLLMKVRSAEPPGADKDPMWPAAAMSSEKTDDRFIESFLWYEYRGKGFEGQRGNVTNTKTERPGYQYVDVLDPVDGKRYRYTAPLQPRDPGSTDLIQKLVRNKPDKAAPLFGVTYEDIVDPEDRKYWIAGTTIRVVELSSSNVIAEQTRFVVDTGQGSTAGFRSPWGWASHYGKKCPTTTGNLASETRWFVDQVLKPKKGE